LEKNKSEYALPLFDLYFVCKSIKIYHSSVVGSGFPENKKSLGYQIFREFSNFDFNQGYDKFGGNDHDLYCQKQKDIYFEMSKYPLNNSEVNLKEKMIRFDISFSRYSTPFKDMHFFLTKERAPGGSRLYYDAMGNQYSGSAKLLKNTIMCRDDVLKDLIEIPGIGKIILANIDRYESAFFV
jgi:hypothetical protein